MTRKAQHNEVRRLRERLAVRPPLVEENDFAGDKALRAVLLDVHRAGHDHLQIQPCFDLAANRQVRQVRESRFQQARRAKTTDSTSFNTTLAPSLKKRSARPLRVRFQELLRAHPSAHRLAAQRSVIAEG